MSHTISLREKKITSKNRFGWVSFYLEHYMGVKDGKKIRKKEFLHIYANPKDRVNYNLTRKHCETILNARQLEVSGIKTGIHVDKRKHESFLDYAQHIAENASGFKTREQWLLAVRHLKTYSPHELSFRDITPTWLHNFQQHLLNQFKQSTARSYSTKIRQAINMAEKDGIIERNPVKHVRQIKEHEGEIKFLYLEEIRLLEKTPHRSNSRRIAFLFNCFCPIRSGDLIKLTESHIRKNNYGGYEVVFVQDKLERPETLPLSDQAMFYLNEARKLARERLQRELKHNDFIFDIGHKKQFGSMLKVWGSRAYQLYGNELPEQMRHHFVEATKKVSPHWARHTGATLMLNAGVPLEMIGEVLGHKDRKTTARYAKVYDRAKYDAIKKMPKL